MPKTESIYINPLTDFGFKLLFGQEENKDLLISFLNGVFQGERVITDVEFVDKERIGENKDGRALIYDLHCKTADGDKIIIEMQNRYQTYFRDRALYYLSGDIYHQGLKGDSWDYSLTPVYGIFLMNFDWREEETGHLREDVVLMNKRSHEIFSDKIAMTFLKIPMMVKDPEECRTILEKWLYVLKNMDKMEAMPKVFMKEPVFQRLRKVAEVAALSESQRREYDKSLKIYRDNYAIAMTERNEGFVEGRVEGKLDTAKNLIGMGMQDDFIVKATGLSASEIAQLRQSAL